MSAQAFQLDPSLAGLSPALLRKRYDQLTPDERRQLGFVRNATDQEMANAGPQQAPGAPADFGGRVLPNSNGVQVSTDTDSGAPTRLPNGVSFQRGNFSGAMPGDVSNPPQAQLVSPTMQTVGAKTVDYDALAQQHGATAAGVDYDALAMQHGAAPETAATQAAPGWLEKNIPLTSHVAATESGLQSIVRGMWEGAKGAWQSVAPPKDDTEKAIAVLGPEALPLYRMARGLGHSASDASQAVHAIHDINQSPDPLGVYAKVAQDTAGSGAGQAIDALLTEGLARAAPAVADTLTNPTKLTAAVRGAAKVTNAVLKAVPDVAGGAAGAYVGHATGIPEGGLLGAIGGRQIGRALANRFGELEIPGEGFGLPNRVEGGPPTAPAYEEPAPSPQATASAPETPAQLLAQPATKANLEKLLNEATGGKPLQKGVSLRNQPQTQAAAPEPTAVPPAAMEAPASALEQKLSNLKDFIKAPAVTPLPEGFTPVDSSLLKGYKYDPEAQTFTAVLKNGQTYTHGEVTPEQVDAFEKADSQGAAWTKNIKQGAGTVLIEKNGVPVKTGTMQSAAGEIIPKSQAGMGDLTSLLQQSLDQANAQKGGVITSATPKDLLDRWGVDPESFAAGREQTRGMSPEDSAASIKKLTAAYKKGQAVEPVMETRDAQNNIVDVDGRGRVLAAHQAGIERIPVIVRRMPASAGQ